MMKKIGRNDPCWCESGKKYKKCHLDREFETPIPLGAIEQRTIAESNIELCLHPSASPRDLRQDRVSPHHPEVESSGTNNGFGQPRANLPLRKNGLLGRRPAGSASRVEGSVYLYWFLLKAR
ncbi:MAG: SEC-C metal-binding domain-containing protein [Terriglobales bacterium]